MSSPDGSIVNWMSRMVSEPYYLLHFLAFFSYIPVRCSAANVLSPIRLSLLLRREFQAFLAFSVLAAVKVVKTESWEIFIADILFFAKIFLVAMSLVMDYHLALWYTLAFFVLYIIAQQPAYEGLGTSNQLTPLQLESLLTDGNTSRFWLGLSCSEWKFKLVSSILLFELCGILTRLWNSPKHNLSFNILIFGRFSNKNVSFGSVDLGLFPNAAEKFGISLASLQQLPIYILYHDGIEISRFPELNFEANFFNYPLSKKLLCRHFELDKLLLDYVNGK